MSEGAALRRLALGGLIALAAAMGIGRFVYTPILPVMVDGLALTKGDAGFIASANFLGYLTGAIITTAMTLPGSRRSWLLGALAVNAGAMAWLGFTVSYQLILSMRFLGGAASAFVLIIASSIVLDRLASAGRGDLVAVHFAGVGIGIAASSALVSTMLHAGADWQSLWLGSAVLSFIAFASVAYLIPAQESASVAATSVGSEPARRDARLRALYCAYGLFGFGYIITATFLVAIVRGSPELAAAEHYIWIVVGASAAISVAIWTWISRRLGVVEAFALGCLIEAVGVALSATWLSTPSVILSAVLFGGTFMGITALGLVAARIMSNGGARSAIAGMTVALSVGQILGPSFAGLVHDQTGSFLLPSLGGAAALLVAAALGWFAAGRHN